LITWKLWRALRNPPLKHALFRRVFAGGDEKTPWYVNAAQTLGLIFFLPVLLFPAAIYSTGWVTGISSRIAKEHVSKTYALLAVSPAGPLGASWAMCLGALYRHRTFRNINTSSTWVGRIILALAVVLGVELCISTASLATINTTMGEASIEFLILLPLRALTIGIALYIDHVQSLILCALVGIAIPGFSQDRTNAQVMAFGLFLLLQVAAYLAAALAGFVILPMLYEALRLDGWLSTILLYGLRLLAFYGAREVIIRVLWGQVAETLNGSPGELLWVGRKTK
jgi:hypothetical protein